MRGTAAPTSKGRGLRGKRVVVIGAGIGGTAIAALLTRRGATPTVLERTSIVGGKAGAYDRRGFNIEVGIHISPRGRRGPLSDVAARTGADVDFIATAPTFHLIYGRRQALLNSRLCHPQSLLRLLRAIRPSVKAYPGLLRFAGLVQRSASERDVAPYHGISASALINRYVTDPDMHAFLNYCSGIMFVLPATEVSASQFLIGLNNWFMAGETAYPRGGYGQIPKAYLQVCTKAGGVSRFNEAVVKIEVESGKVTGVRTATSYYPADIVISNAGIAQTAALVDSDAMPESFLAKTKTARDSETAVVVKYALDKRYARAVASLYMPKRFDANAHLVALRENQLPGETPLFIIAPTVADPSLAPRGKHLLLACTGAISTAFDKRMNDGLLDLVEAQLQRIYPGIQRSVIFRERCGVPYYRAIGGRENGAAIGLAQRYDQDGDHRFSPRMPVLGLYVVGADTGPNGIGTERAASSALLADEMIAADVDDL